MKMKMIAFWSYDTFPFCIWGELLSADEESFKVKGYDGMKFMNRARIAFLPEIQAKPIIAKLEKLTADKKAADDNFKREAKKIFSNRV